MLEDEATHRTVAERLGVSRNVVARLWIPGQGRERATTARQDHYFQNMAYCNRRSAARTRQSVFQQDTNVV